MLFKNFVFLDERAQVEMDYDSIFRFHFLQRLLSVREKIIEAFYSIHASCKEKYLQIEYASYICNQAASFGEIKPSIQTYFVTRA
jgi:hypothetical protein